MVGGFCGGKVEVEGCGMGDWDVWCYWIVRRRDFVKECVAVC